jgi:hypothetical protein
MLRIGWHGQHRPRCARATRGLSVVLALAATALATAPAAMAWKPFAHNYVGYQAYNDALDGSVTIGGSNYPLDPRLVAALNSPGASAWYNAGVIGPDGFPDLAFGQSQIHPNHTGRWLSYIWQKAWDAQGDARYRPAQKAQILAFAYGFLTHAAGDMWGHSLINAFANGLFPSLDEIQDDRNAALIAVRHIVAEGYAGSATPGWDRTIGPAAKVCVTPTSPGTKCKDVSDDSSGAVRLPTPPKDPPSYRTVHDFLYEILVSPDARLPVGTCQSNGDADGDGKPDPAADDDGDGKADEGCPKGPFTTSSDKNDPSEPQRGPLVDFFLDTEADVQVDYYKRHFDATHDDCDHNDRNCVRTNVERNVSTVRGTKTLRLHWWQCKPNRSCGSDSDDDDQDDDDQEVAKDLREWYLNIRKGLRHWTEFSLGVSQALFNPQARRDTQNYKCRNRGKDELIEHGDSGSERRDKETRHACEKEVGLFATIEYQTRTYVDTYLLAMLGYADVAKTKSWYQELLDDIDDAIGETLNPLHWLANQIEEKLAEFVNNAIRDAIGVDLDDLSDVLHTPSRWMCGAGNASITLPKLGRLATLTEAQRTITAKQLFTKADHDRLDTIMGLQPNHHGSTSDCTRLRSTSQYDPNRFAPIKNSITQAKLLLLDGPELDRALGDVLKNAHLINETAAVHTYQPSENVMFSSLGTPIPWLELIDGDHAWRENGLPRFCDGVSACLTPAGASVTATPRNTGGSTGGTGRYPIWESCVLRPAFRELFTDWENALTFPDLGDAVSPDPATDPTPPTATATPAAVTTTIEGKPFVLPGTSFTATGTDAVFAARMITLSYRTYKSGTVPGPFQPVDNGGTFALPLDTGGGDWVVELAASDPCGSSTSTQTFGIA